MSSDCKKFYDPEYDRIVNEDVPKRQFDWFSKQPWFKQSYEEFLNENFLPAEDAKYM